ncbi:MATE family efflux transporter [Phreatobacter aquaticus]|uniref:MATE family efflux transporter n=1 Tax=Phreatobacter aquaticus TaxID=2570229 RepID=A0A4D7QSC3_9HYPH|nr:MATE family efflux transporter [Phreatobacter aquaticus]QCK88446.1 MATE family efflux transporter [Phreatobacter aquaticus]
MTAANASPAFAGKPVHPLLAGPILPTIIRLSIPNMMAMVATAAVAVAETVYVGLLGIPALAGMALVFPMVMLQQMMSAGAMGGGVSSAISRALGAGDEARARSLAVHTVLIAVGAGLSLSALFLLFGRQIYVALGGAGAALEQALLLSNTLFAGIVAVWLCNLLASVVRGSGNMRLPSTTLVAVAALQVVLGGTLSLGLGPFPRLGMLGLGLGQVLAYGAGAAWFFVYLMSGKSRIALSFSGVRFRPDHFMDILRVGALACLSSFQSVLTVLVLTRLVARFGEAALAGYGIGSRLEFLLIPFTFAVGVSLVPMVGTAIGAGQADRARRAAWTGGLMAFLITGTIGLAGWLMPTAWARLFTTDLAVIESARSYLVWAGPAFGFYGLGLCLYFAAQGAGRVLGPVLAGSARLITVALGGWWLVATDQPQWMMFALVGVSMVVYGLATAYAIARTRWGGVRG